MTSNSSNMIQWHPPASWQDLDLFTALLYSDGLDVEGALRRGCGRVEPTLDFEDFDQILGEYLMALWFCVSCWIEMIMYHNIIYIYIYNYLRAAAPAADPGRIGKEAKQIGIKTLRCFAPWGFRPFSYVYCCEIFDRFEFSFVNGFFMIYWLSWSRRSLCMSIQVRAMWSGGVAVWVAVFDLGWTYNKWHYHKGIFTLWSWTKLHCVARGCLARNCWFVLMVFSFHFFLGWCVWPPLRES